MNPVLGQPRQKNSTSRHVTVLPGDHMHIRALRTAGLLALVALSAGAVSGCGSEKEGGSTAEVAVDRARQVAAAWDGSQAADAWRAGYYPMGEAVQLPRGGLRSQADKRAYQAQNFVLRGELPTTRPKDGRVAWASGVSLTRPLVGAHTAYMTLARARVEEIPHLTVTGAKLGEMTLATSRGPATVPAWFFMLQGYATPPQARRRQPVEATPTTDLAGPRHPRRPVGSARPAGPD